MGGQSYKCPMCNRWFLAKGALRDHLKGKHKCVPPFEIKGVGPLTEVKTCTTTKTG